MAGVGVAVVGWGGGRKKKTNHQPQVERFEVKCVEHGGLRARIAGGTVWGGFSDLRSLVHGAQGKKITLPKNQLTLV